MKIYGLKNNDYTLITDYIESQYKTNRKETKLIYNILKYLYKNNNKFNDNYNIYTIEKDKFLIDSWLVDFVSIYDITITELIENKILTEKEPGDLHE